MLTKTITTTLFVVSFLIPLLGEDVVLGELVLVEGGVTLQEDGEDLPLEAGQALAEGDIIQTDSEGSVEVTLGDTNQFLLGPNSRLEAKKGNKKQGLHLILDRGLIRAKLENWDPNESFSIRTPVAVAGVRGTDFVVEATDENDTGFELDVLDGLVEVESDEVKRESFGAGKGLKLDRQGRVKERRDAIRQNIKHQLKNIVAFREALKRKWAKRKKANLLKKFKGFKKGDRLKTLKAKLQKKSINNKKDLKNNIRERIRTRRERTRN